METKFTKGKWRVKHSESKDAWNVIGTELGSRYKIARCPYLVCHSEIVNLREKTEQLANAKLISFAPEMLEMLKDVINHSRALIDVNGLKDGTTILDRAEQLLKEATEL